MGRVGGDMFTARRVVVFLVDLVLIASALVFSFLLSFDFTLSATQLSLLVEGLAIVLVAKPSLFAASDMYRSICSSTSIHEAYEIFKLVSFSSLISGLLLIFIRGAYAFPLSIFLLDWFILYALLLTSRLVLRTLVYDSTVEAERKVHQPQ